MARDHTKKIDYLGWANLIILSITAGAAIWLVIVTIHSSAEQAELTRESFMAIQRAFVVVNGLDINPVRNKNGKVVSWSIAPIIENAGNTPTQNMRLTLIGSGGGGTYGLSLTDAERYRVRFPIDPADAFTADPFFKEHPVQTSLTTLGPKARLPMFEPKTKGPTDSDLLQKIFEDKLSNDIMGVIHYEDIFPGSAPHITKFCYQILAFHGIDGEIVPTFRNCRHWNCTDEECTHDKEEYNAELAVLPVSKPAEFPAK